MSPYPDSSSNIISNRWQSSKGNVPGVCSVDPTDLHRVRCLERQTIDDISVLSPFATQQPLEVLPYAAHQEAGRAMKIVTGIQ
jgi:hypothetical protein